MGTGRPIDRPRNGTLPYTDRVSYRYRSSIYDVSTNVDLEIYWFINSLLIDPREAKRAYFSVKTRQVIFQRDHYSSITFPSFLRTASHLRDPFACV